MATFHKLIEDTEKNLEQGKGFTLSDLHNINLDSDSIPFSNREIKLLRCHYCHISTPSEANKPSLVFFTKNLKEDMADLIQSIDPIKECARALRKIFLDENFALEDQFCGVNDLQEAWKKRKIPGHVMDFMSVLFNFNSNNFSRKNEADDQEDDEIWDHNPEAPVSKRER